MQIQSLFDENIPVEHFDAPKAMSKAERLSQMTAAANAEKNRECIKAFREFLIRFNQENSLFIIADVIEAYKKSKKAQPAKDFRCVGSTVNQLTKDGVLIPTGEKRLIPGGTNRLMTVYRGKI